MNIQQAFQLLISPEREGATLSDIPGDHGGLSKYGVSQAAYPGEDIAALTPERAAFLYERDYWTPLRCIEIPDPLRFDLFDAGVNSGVRQATKFLQRALGGVAVDGELGDLTMAAVHKADPVKLMRRFNGLRMQFDLADPQFHEFAHSWMQRIAANLVEV